MASGGLVRCLCCLLAALAGAGGDAGPADRVSGAAVLLAAPPALDGDVVGDPAWRGMTPFTNFKQLQPDNGKPATQRTEGVHWLYRRSPVRRRRLPRGPVEDRPVERRLRLGQFHFRAGHVSQRADRAGVRNQSGGRGVRRAAGRLGQLSGLELEHGVGSPGEDQRTQLERRVRDSLHLAALRRVRRTELGRELRPRHPPPQRDRLLVAGAQATQHVPPGPGGRRAWPPAAEAAAQSEGHALRPWRRRAGAGRFHRARRRSRFRRQVLADAELDLGPHLQTRISRRWSPTRSR